MDKIYLLFEVDKQKLVQNVENRKVQMVGRTYGIAKSKFTIATDSTWLDADKIIASFQSSSSPIRSYELDGNRECFIPREVLVDSSFTVSLSGYVGSIEKITTNCVRVFINPGCESSEVIPEIPQPDIYAQLLEEIQLKGDTLSFEDNILKLLSGEIELSRVTIIGGGGTSAKEIELQNSGTYIQWRYVGDVAWINLVSLLELTGDPGYTPVKGVDYYDGAPGLKGDPGDDGYTPVKGVDYYDGLPGTNGRGIVGINKTGTVGSIDTYTITFTDATNTTFAIQNGINGLDGDDGYTPIKGVDYYDGNDGNGITSIVKTGSVGLIDTYTITFTDTTTDTFQVINGAEGPQGDPGLDGSPDTAAEILVKLLTVDGSGSGLDADMLEGHNSDVNNTADTIVLRDGFGSIIGNTVKLDTTPDLTNLIIGELFYDSTNMTAALRTTGGVTIQLGQEETVPVLNNSGSVIADGTLVYWSEAVGASGRVRVLPFLANGVIEGERCIGVATENIENGASGLITSRGMLNNLNTSGTPYGETWADGDILYASPTIAGGFTKVKPDSTKVILRIGIVVRAHATTGVIFFRPTLYQRTVGVSVADAVTLAVTLAANTPVKIATLTTCTSLTISLGAGNWWDEYKVFFKTGATAPTITLPPGIEWADGVAPTFIANKTYEISIMNNLWRV